MKAVRLANMNFAKKAEAEEFLRERMQSYVLDERIPADEEALWFSVLQRHEWFDEYVAHGIKFFAVARSVERPNLRNMVAVNEQGEQKPFSYKKYLTGAPLSKLSKVKAALRLEVVPHIEAYRAALFGNGTKPICDVSGKRLEPRRCHIHHQGIAFLQIVDEFLTANAHRWQAFETEGAGNTGYRLTDRRLAAEWFSFHESRAQLQAVASNVNLQAGAGGYKMKFIAP